MNPDQSHRELARRLKELRERQWPELKITQRQLAEALGEDKPLSTSLISSWESAESALVPPAYRLAAYAMFFATRRSVDGSQVRLLNDDELTEDERVERDQIQQELLRLRFPESNGPSEEAPRRKLAGPTDEIGGGRWYFSDQKPVVIAAAPLPSDLLANIHNASRDHPDYVEAYRYADLDAIFELFGHIRAVNPTISVAIRDATSLSRDELTHHLVLLGGVDWNPLFEESAEHLDLPVRQVARVRENDIGGFQISSERLEPVVDRKDDGSVTLREDVALFYRDRNPYNRRRTVTLCSGSFTRGTYGAVRALTDAKFRDRNEEYLNRMSLCGIITRVPIAGGETVTPDWTEPRNRLYEWPEANDA